MSQPITKHEVIDHCENRDVQIEWKEPRIEHGLGSDKITRIKLSRGSWRIYLAFGGDVDMLEIVDSCEKLINQS
jgi:hypothetical protein